MEEQSLKSKTAKGLFWGGLSNGSMQLVGLIVGIILLKLLTPEDYGIVGLLAIFSGIAGTIQDSGFTAALVNRPIFDSKDYNAVFWFNIIVGWGLYGILFLLAPLIADFYNTPELVKISRIMFLSFAVVSLGIAHNALLVRELMVKERAIIDIAAITFSGITAVVLALNGWGYWALVIQTLVYTIVGVILRWYFSSWKPTLSFTMQPLREMFGFSFKLLFSSIITQIQANIFSVLLGRYTTKADVGYFAQGTKWAGMGTMLINGMVNGVAQPVFAQIVADKNRATHVFRKILRFIAFVSFPTLLGLAFVGRELISMINVDWLPCVPILQMYCVAGMVAPIQILYSQLVVTYGRSDFYFWCTLFFAVAQIGMAVLTLPFGLYWMAFSNMIVSFAYLFAWHVFLSRIITISLFQLCKDVFPYLLITLISFSIAWIALLPIDNIYIRFLGKILIAASLYILTMWKMESVVFKESLHFFMSKFR